MATRKPFLLITKELTEDELNKITEIIGSDSITKHMPKTLSSSHDTVDFEIAFNKSGYLVVAVGGKEISGQRDLMVINSKLNDVINVDVNFILTKKALGFNEV